MCWISYTDFLTCTQNNPMRQMLADEETELELVYLSKGSTTIEW